MDIVLVVLTWRFVSTWASCWTLYESSRMVMMEHERTPWFMIVFNSVMIIIAGIGAIDGARSGVMTLVRYRRLAPEDGGAGNTEPAESSPRR